MGQRWITQQKLELKDNENTVYQKLCIRLPWWSSG